MSAIIPICFFKICKPTDMRGINKLAYETNFLFTVLNEDTYKCEDFGHPGYKNNLYALMMVFGR